MDSKKPPAKTTNNMFDPEQTIAEWRRQMAAGGIKTPEVLNELESHLREDVEQQGRLGLNAQQAFEVAIQRIGQADVLKAEFGKAGETKEARERKFARLTLSIVCLGYFWLLLMGINTLLKGEMGSIERLLGFAAVAVSVISIFSGRYIYRFLPVLPDSRVRTAIQFVCFLPAIIWLPIYTYIILPRFDFTVGQLFVATLWTMTLLAVVGVITNGMDKAAHKQTATDNSLTSQS
jgi:hypothetical protein